MSARICVQILAINSDPEVGRQLKVLLERQGHHVLVSPGVSEALFFLDARRVDLVLAECRQLEEHGSALFRLLGRWAQPPVILPTISHPATDHSPSALSAEVERVLAAVVQVRLLLTQPREEVLRVGDLSIDTASKRVFVHGRPVLLPPIQFRLLAYLAQNAGRVVGARELLRAVWGYEGDETEARELVKVHVRQIRRRLGFGGQNGDYVQSVRGFGYVVTAPAER